MQYFKMTTPFCIILMTTIFGGSKAFFWSSYECEVNPDDVIEHEQACERLQNTTGTKSKTIRWIYNGETKKCVQYNFCGTSFTELNKYYSSEFSCKLFCLRNTIKEENKTTTIPIELVKSTRGVINDTFDVITGVQSTTTTRGRVPNTTMSTTTPPIIVVDKTTTTEQSTLIIDPTPPLIIVTDKTPPTPPSTPVVDRTPKTTKTPPPIIVVDKTTTTEPSTTVVYPTPETITTTVVYPTAETTTTSVVYPTAETTTTPVVYPIPETITTPVVYPTAETTTTPIIKPIPEKTTIQPPIIVVDKTRTTELPKSVVETKPSTTTTTTPSPTTPTSIIVVDTTPSTTTTPIPPPVDKTTTSEVAITIVNQTATTTTPKPITKVNRAPSTTGEKVTTNQGICHVAPKLLVILSPNCKHFRLTRKHKVIRRKWVVDEWYFDESSETCIKRNFCAKWLAMQMINRSGKFFRKKCDCVAACIEAKKTTTPTYRTTSTTAPPTTLKPNTGGGCMVGFTSISPRK